MTEEQPEVVVRGTVRRHEEHWIVSLFLVNGQREPKVRRDEAWIFRQRPWRRDPDSTDRVAYEEESAMAMVYRRHVGFATGHNTSVHADTDPDDPRRAVRITSSRRWTSSRRCPGTARPRCSSARWTAAVSVTVSARPR